jgi:hypothetical protein
MASTRVMALGSGLDCRNGAWRSPPSISFMLK